MSDLCLSLEFHLFFLCNITIINPDNCKHNLRQVLHVTMSVMRLFVRVTIQHHFSQLYGVFSTANIIGPSNPKFYFLNCLWGDRTKAVQSGVAMSSSALVVFVSWISMMPYPTLGQGEFEKWPSIFLSFFFAFSVLCIARLSVYVF